MHRIFAGMAVWATIFLIGQVVLGFVVDRQDRLLMRWHMLLGVFAAIYVCVLHIMVMFHFIGSGKEVKEAVQVLGGDTEVAQRLRRFKSQVFPFATFAPIFVGAAAILGGGADTGALPSWVHWSIGGVGIVFNLYAFPIEYRALIANLELLHEVDLRIKREISPGLPHE